MSITRIYNPRNTILKSMLKAEYPVFLKINLRKDGRTRDSYHGEGEIRTLEQPFDRHTLSRRAH